MKNITDCWSDKPGFLNNPTSRVNRAARAFNRTMSRICVELHEQKQTATVFAFNVSNEDFVWPKGVRKTFLGLSLERLMFVQGPDDTLFISNGHFAFGPVGHVSMVNRPKDERYPHHLPDLTGSVPADILRGKIVRGLKLHKEDTPFDQDYTITPGWEIEPVYLHAALDFLGFPTTSSLGSSVPEIAARACPPNHINPMIVMTEKNLAGSPVALHYGGKVAVVMPKRMS